MRLGQVIRGIYLHCQRIMASLASSMLMHLHADLQINAMAAEKRQSSNSSFCSIWSEHRNQEKPGPQNCNFHTIQTSNRSVRKVSEGFWQLEIDGALRLRSNQHGSLSSQRNLMFSQSVYVPCLWHWEYTESIVYLQIMVDKNLMDTLSVNNKTMHLWSYSSDE